MSYQIKIDPKSLNAARFISRLQKAIQKALVDSGKTQQEVAEILDVDRSVVNRRLKGMANITARSIADFAYAFDKDVFIKFVDQVQADRSNWGATTDSVVEIQPRSKSASKGTIDPLARINVESAAS